MSNYDPSSFAGLQFTTSIPSFKNGSDSPSHYLERCIDVIGRDEARVQAFAATNFTAARAAAAASSARWHEGKPLSAVDGMPVGIKDLLETKDMPTEFGCRAYAGNFPKRDNAAVWALREAGAVIVGKTVTAELGGTHPGLTTNPFDATKTPGGSSSGSAAAVAAGMIPTAIGTQVGGSIIRPAGFCGNVALKPSQGGINRGERQATSMSTHGVHANSIDDMWQVAIEIAKRAGGDRGFPGLTGPSETPAAIRPTRIAVLETQGFANLDDASKTAFDDVIEQLRALGIGVVTRHNNALVETLELTLREASRFGGLITAWENHWAQRNLIDEHPDGVSDRAKRTVEIASQMTPDDYRNLLLEREIAQAAHRRLNGVVDAMLTLSCPGPAPEWLGDVPGEPLAPRPTGDAVFNVPSSVLFAPAVTVPLMAIGGLPVGVQFMGQHGDDANMTGIARWAFGRAFAGRPIIALSVDAPILERWGLRGAKPIDSARNQHFRVSQNGRPLVLRRYRDDHFSDLAFERDVMTTLGQQGWPVPTIVDHIDDDDAPWLLMTECPGVSRAARSQAEQRERGQLLARLHSALASFDRARNGFTPIDEIVHSETLTNNLAAFARENPAQGRQLQHYLDATREMFARTSIDACPRTVIHGDFATWNLLFEAERLTGILDFEVCHRAPFVFDFAMSWRGCYDGVIEGYEIHRRLTAAERTLIVPCFWAWLLFGIDHTLRSTANATFDWELKQFARRESVLFEGWRGLLPRSE